MKNQRYAWYAALVLMLCYALSFIDRQILGLLAPQIKADLGISDTGVSLLQGFSFALTMSIAGTLMLIVFWISMRPYRADYLKMHKPQETGDVSLLRRDIWNPDHPGGATGKRPLLSPELL